MQGKAIANQKLADAEGVKSLEGKLCVSQKLAEAEGVKSLEGTALSDERSLRLLGARQIYV